MHVPAGTTIDIVTFATSHGWGWTAREMPTGDPVTHVMERHRRDHVPQTVAGHIGEWLRTLPGDGAVTIRCHTAIIRSALVTHVDPQRVALVDGLALGPGAGWAEQARSELVTALTELEEALRQRRTLYAASDGASHPAYGNGAFSWVDQFGKFEVGRAPRNITDAEIAGIIAFAKQVRFGTFGKAVLFVDSLRAIRAFQIETAQLWRQADQEGLMQTLSMLRNRRLELVWVRGHNGHVLNDVADRLALMRHRAVRMQLSEDAVRQAALNIVDQERDRLLSVTWSKERLKALRAWRLHEEAQTQAQQS